MSVLTERMIGAATLRTATYEDVEHDPSATGQAVLVVVMSSVAAALGAGLGINGIALIRGTAFALIGWLIWAGLTFLIGTKLLPAPGTRATLGEVLRTTGFASAPGILRIFGVIPFFTGLVFFITSIWMLMTFVVAVQQALDYSSPWRAVAVCLVGWLVYVTLAIFVR